MMSILKEETEKVGLEMHDQKAKVLTNGLSQNGDNQLDIRKLFYAHLNAKRTIKTQRKQKKRQAPEKRASPSNKDPTSDDKNRKQKMINRGAGCHKKVEHVEHTGDHKETKNQDKNFKS